MAKRKSNSATPSSQRKRKSKSRQSTASSALPEVFDDDIEQSFDNSEGISQSLFEDSVLADTGDSTSDDDFDLPEGLISFQDEEEPIKAGDIVWVKHSAKDCFWPAYVKSASNKHVKVFYISQNRFTKGEKTIRYIAKSKKIKQFCSSNNQVLTENGREHCRSYDLRQKDSPNFTETALTFDKAVNLAETYMLAQSNHPFTSEQEVFDFFQSDGISLCHKKCVEEQNSAGTPTQYAIVQTSATTTVETVPLLTSKLVDKNIQNVSANETPCSPYKVSSKRPKRRSKLKSECVVKCYNARNADIVSYIINGNCNDHLKSILDGATYSERMCQFNSRWPVGANSPLKKVVPPKTAYFIDDQQLEQVCQYLNKFITSYAKISYDIIRKDDLLFSVLLPEASIYSICKVRRRNLRFAEKIFEDGCKEQRKNSDAELNKPLTDEERFACQRRISSLAEELAIPQLTF